MFSDFYKCFSKKFFSCIFDEKLFIHEMKLFYILTYLLSLVNIEEI